MVAANNDVSCLWFTQVRAIRECGNADNPLVVSWLLAPSTQSSSHTTHSASPEVTLCYHYQHFVSLYDVTIHVLPYVCVHVVLALETGIKGATINQSIWISLVGASVTEEWIWGVNIPSVRYLMARKGWGQAILFVSFSTLTRLSDSKDI